MALFAMAGALFSVWIALRWGPILLPVGDGWSPVWGGFSPAWIAALLFALPAAALLALAFRPAIVIYPQCLRIGRREIPWTQIHRLDQTGWNVPLILYLTMKDQTRVLVLYPGDFESSASLLRHLRRHAREALLDGVPYRQFWGEPPAGQRKQLPPPRFRVLRPEDEDEVERMFQRLKSAGHLEHHEPEEK